MILPEKLTQKIREAHDKLDGQGEIFSKSQLTKFLDTFRQRFGPAKLNSIDGEALLEIIHNNSNFDSLVYWLEHKNDDEFPGPKFGSIGGGSALKFGIYRRKETGAWMTGSPQKQREIDIDEAVDIARKHRSQFTKGIEILENFPASASDSDYMQLQKEMDQHAPDVSNTAWGHKYFSIFYMDKIDDFHNPNYQRFHLRKLMQMPPQGEGRYVCAGRYVEISKELNIPIHNLTRVLSNINGKPHYYWRIGTKIGDVSRWDLMKDNDCVAVGWHKIGDLSHIKYKKGDKEEIRTAMTEQYPKDPQTIGRQTQQLFNFVASIDEGDLVIPSDGEKILGIGTVEGEYFHEPDSDAPHRRSVKSPFPDHFSKDP